MKVEVNSCLIWHRKYFFFLSWQQQKNKGFHPHINYNFSWFHFNVVWGKWKSHEVERSTGTTWHRNQNKEKFRFIFYQQAHTHRTIHKIYSIPRERNWIRKKGLKEITAKGKCAINQVKVIYFFVMWN